MNQPPSGNNEAKTSSFKSSNTRITTGLQIQIKSSTAAELKRAARRSQASPYPKTPPKTKRFTAQTSPLNVPDLFELPPSPVIEAEVSADLSFAFTSALGNVAPAADATQPSSEEMPPAPAP